MQALVTSRVFVLFVMALLTFGITQGLKWLFVKKWTNKLENPRLRKAINSVIFFFPYFVAYGIEFAYTTFVTSGEPNALIALVVGGGGHSVYGFFELIYGIFTGEIKVKKHATTDEEKTVEDFVHAVAEDGKIDANDSPALNAFIEMVK